jgi:hypothetical protein
MYTALEGYGLMYQLQQRPWIEPITRNPESLNTTFFGNENRNNGRSVLKRVQSNKKQERDLYLPKQIDNNNKNKRASETASTNQNKWDKTEAQAKTIANKYTETPRAAKSTTPLSTSTTPRVQTTLTKQTINKTTFHNSTPPNQNQSNNRVHSTPHHQSGAHIHVFSSQISSVLLGPASLVIVAVVFGGMVQGGVLRTPSSVQAS